jgi:pyruvate-formate lyase
MATYSVDDLIIGKIKHCMLFIAYCWEPRLIERYYMSNFAGNREHKSITR